jgi:hypothetical protein
MSKPDAPPPWPKNPDGTEKRLGDLTQEEADAHVKWALKKLVAELEGRSARD